MTEEQNKLAEEIERNGINGRDDFSIADKEAIIAAIRREPATEAVLVGNVYAWLGYWRDKFPSEAVSGLQDILGPLDRALKGKGASQGEVRQCPMQDGPPIPWSLAEKIWQGYAKLGGDDQPLEEVARRGGFTWTEVAYIWSRSEARRAIESALSTASPMSRRDEDAKR